jgi:hypothetical protein
MRARRLGLFPDGIRLFKLVHLHVCQRVTALIVPLLHKPGRERYRGSILGKHVRRELGEIDSHKATRVR